MPAGPVVIAPPVFQPKKASSWSFAAVVVTDGAFSVAALVVATAHASIGLVGSTLPYATIPPDAFLVPPTSVQVYVEGSLAPATCQKIAWRRFVLCALALPVGSTAVQPLGGVSVSALPPPTLISASS